MEDIMAKIAKKLTDLIGNTPLLELGAYGEKEGVLGKLVREARVLQPAVQR